MNLDLTKLLSLSSTGNTERDTNTQPPTAPTSPSETIKANTATETRVEGEKPIEANPEGLGGLAKLQGMADDKKREIDRALAICREYQQNTRNSSQLQAEILKGARAGEDIYSLFLKAVKAISLMTTNTLFYSQLEGDVRAIYGVGLGEPTPIQMELQQAQERYTKLQNALETEPNGDSRERLQKAVTAHAKRISELEAKQNKR